ncbi:MAG TPA: glycosyltransferase [Kiritimatiellia bacterium]|nr:glycosyltransferase [Kiritimatiellia bacterium]
MNVVFLMQDVPRLYGAERVTVELAMALGRRVPVRFCLIGEQRLGGQPGALHEAVHRSGLPVERFPVTGRFSWPLVRAVRQRLASCSSPILHTVGYKAHLHALAAAHGVAPTVTTIHGWLVRPEWKERFYEWLEVRALRLDRAVVCLTSFYERRLLDAGVRRSRLHRIPTGLAPEQLPDLGRARTPPEGTFTVALVGRLSWEKNHDLVLRAAVRLREKGIPLRIILAGEGPERTAIESRVRSLDLADTVRFDGYVAMADLLPGVHAVVLCSRIENLPLSLLEAMAWARPVVATAVGGVPDVVQDGETGWLVPDNDDAVFAERLAQLASDPSAARRMGLAGRERVEREFLIERGVTRHLELYSMLRPASP